MLFEFGEEARNKSSLTMRFSFGSFQFSWIKILSNNLNWSVLWNYSKGYIWLDREENRRRTCRTIELFGMIPTESCPLKTRYNLSLLQECRFAVMLFSKRLFAERTASDDSGVLRKHWCELESNKKATTRRWTKRVDRCGRFEAPAWCSLNFSISHNHADQASLALEWHQISR